MRALVTGANGFVGSNVVRELLANGATVRAFVRPGSEQRTLAGLPVDRRFGDVRDRAALETAAEDCEVIYHAAAVYSYWPRDAREQEETAIAGTRNVVQAAAARGVRRIVLTSSSVVLGSASSTVPRDESSDQEDRAAELTPYFRAKSLQERVLFDTARPPLEAVSVCPTITIGPHDYRLTPSHALLVRYLADPLKTTFPGGCNVVSVTDVARGHRLIGESGDPGQRYVLGGENLEWSLLHRMASELYGAPGPLWTANRTASYLAAGAMELSAVLTGRSPASTRDEARSIGRFFWYRHDRAAALGYAPRPARVALAEALEWLAFRGFLIRPPT